MEIKILSPSSFEKRYFFTVVDSESILKVMDLYMRTGANQSCKFIAAIHSKELDDQIHKGGYQIEGARPCAAATSDKGRMYTLTNGDSGYRGSCGTVWLHNITKLELLYYPDFQKDEADNTSGKTTNACQDENTVKKLS